MKGRFARSLLAAVLVIVSACADETDVADSSTTPTSAAATPSSVSTTESVPPSSTVPAPTSTASTSTSTEPPVVTSTYPAQTPGPTRTPAGTNRAGGIAVGFLEADGLGLVRAIDLTTGVTEQVASIPLEARWIGRVQLGWDGDSLYYWSQREDYWFSCDSSPGEVIELDLATGKERPIAIGTEPRLSPDGRSLAYLAASQCLPDPQDPLNFRVTPYDSVVVRDLESGDESTWLDVELRDGFAEELAGDFDEAQLGGLVWLGNEELAVADRRISVATMDELARGPDLRSEVGGHRELVGFDQTSELVLAEQEIFTVDGERRVQLIGVDPDSGLTTVFVPSSESPDAAFAFDSPYDSLAAFDGGRLVIEGREVQVDIVSRNIDW